MSIRDYPGLKTGCTAKLPGEHQPLTEAEIRTRAQWEPGSVAVGAERKAKLRARGRVRKAKGEMNATETAFSRYLEQERMDGRVLWWRFEAWTFRLADRTTWTPDFVVLYWTREIWAIDVKGAKKTKAGKYVPFVEPQTAVKVKICAEQFPVVVCYSYQLPKKAGGQWIIEEI